MIPSQGNALTLQAREGAGREGNDLHAWPALPPCGRLYNYSQPRSLEEDTPAVQSVSMHSETPPTAACNPACPHTAFPSSVLSAPHPPGQEKVLGSGDPRKCPVVTMH